DVAEAFLAPLGAQFDGAAAIVAGGRGGRSPRRVGDDEVAGGGQVARPPLAAGLLQGQAPGGVEPLIAVAVGGRDDRAPVAQHGPVAGSGRRRRQGRRGRSGGAGGGCETGEYGKNQGP